MAKKFLRRDSVRYSKLGKNRKKLQKWRKPKGRDSKTRLKRKGYPIKVSIGFKSSPKDKKISPILVHNTNDLDKIGKSSLIIIAKVGAKKKMDIIKQAQEKNLEIVNVKVGKHG